MDKYRLIYWHPARFSRVQVIIEETNEFRAESLSRALYRLSLDWQLIEIMSANASEVPGFTRIG